MKKIIIRVLPVLLCMPQLWAPSQTVNYLKAINTNEDTFDQSPVLRRAYDDRYGYGTLKRYKPLIQKMIAQEKKFADTHYVFYHAIPNMYVMAQDLTKGLYMHEHKRTPGSLTNWVPFRIPGSKTFSDYQNVDSYLEHVINTHTEVNDHYPLDSTYLLSANVSLFGNSLPDHVFSESSFAIFLKNSGARTELNIDQIIDGILTHYKIPTLYRQQFITIAQKYLANAGSLVQIFIPKNKVRKYAYFARNYGKPYGSPEALGILFNRSLKKQRLSDFWNLLSTHPLQALGSSADDIDRILAQYQQDCQKIKNYDMLSARIIISNDFLLDPTSGVEIFRYNALENNDPSTYNAHKEAMEKLIANIAT